MLREADAALPGVLELSMLSVGTFAASCCPMPMITHGRSDRRGTARRPATWRACVTSLALGLATLAAAPAAWGQGIDHAPFDALLKANVNNGVVNYPGFQGSASFRKYIDDLARPVQLDAPGDKLAYYINAYNALAIQGILDGLSPSSLFGRLRYFKLREWPLNGQTVTLYDLEHKFIRPLGEPRIHFAIICASKSCPFLRPEAYASARLDRQLDEQARQFVNDTFRNRFDKATRTATLSEIFKWFDEDFTPVAGSTPRYVARYVADPEVAKDLAADAYKIDFIAYDWNLNGMPPTR